MHIFVAGGLVPLLLAILVSGRAELRMDPADKLMPLAVSRTTTLAGPLSGTSAPYPSHPAGGRRLHVAHKASITLRRRPRVGAPVPPLVFASAPCAGSTAVQMVAREMLRRHHLQVDDWLHWEELRPNKNSLMKKGVVPLSAAVEAQIDSAQSRGKVFFNKLEIFPTDVDTMRLLVRRGGRVVNVWRSNALDFAACNVRDCFTRWLGKPVHGNGTGTDLCFSRRWLDSPPLAYLYPGILEKALRDFLNTARFQLHQLRKAGFRRFSTVSSEALMAFGSSPDRVEESMRAWQKFLQSLGLRPNVTAIAEVLNGGCGKTCTVGARPDKPHAAAIWNIQEVAAIVRRSANPKIRALLRE